MALPILDILDAVISHAARSGLFDQVNGHEPESPPGHGITAAVWVDSIEPVRSSGLAEGSGRLLLQVRLYTSADQSPPDAIDPNMVTAVDALLTAYAGDFELGGNVRCVDLLGMAGPPMRARAGFIGESGQAFRIYNIDLPLLVNDLWPQTP